MAEAAVAAESFVDFVDLFPIDALVAGYYHLADAFAVVDDEGFLGEVNDDDTNLAAVVGVDGAGGVGDGDTMFERKAGAGAYLTLEAAGELHVKAGGYKYTFERLQHDGVGEESADIHA